MAEEQGRPLEPECEPYELIRVYDAISNIDYPGCDSVEWIHKAKVAARELLEWARADERAKRPDQKQLIAVQNAHDWWDYVSDTVWVCKCGPRMAGKPGSDEVYRAHLADAMLSSFALQPEARAESRLLDAVRDALANPEADYAGRVLAARDLLAGRATPEAREVTAVGVEAGARRLFVYEAAAAGDEEGAWDGLPNDAPLRVIYRTRARAVLKPQLGSRPMAEALAGHGDVAKSEAVLKERVVYVGRRMTPAGKIAHWYMPVSREGSLYGSLTRYSDGQGIGAVLEISRPPDQPTSTYVTGEHAPRVVDVWSDEAEIAEWRVLDRAEYQQSVAAARVRKGLREMPDEFEEALRVLTRHFARLNHSQRAALLPLVQARVLGGGGL